MPVIYTKLYIQTNRHDDVVILDNVYEHKWCHWYEYQDTYRDSWLATGSVSHIAGGLGSSTAAPVPAIGKPGTSPASTPISSELLYTAPDEQTHVPPRYKKVLCSGDIFSIVSGVSIPEPTAPTSWSATFTAATTDICTATAHGRATGDLVTVQTTTTLPAGLASTVIYEFIKIDANTFTLRTQSTGAIVDITSTGTGTHTITLVTPITLPANTAGLIRFPSTWEIGISTSDPRV
jgi:hypothetical protein